MQTAFDLAAEARQAAKDAIALANDAAIAISKIARIEPGSPARRDLDELVASLRDATIVLERTLASKVLLALEAEATERDVRGETPDPDLEAASLPIDTASDAKGPEIARAESKALGRALERSEEVSGERALAILDLEKELARKEARIAALEAFVGEIRSYLGPATCGSVFGADPGKPGWCLGEGGISHISCQRSPFCEALRKLDRGGRS